MTLFTVGCPVEPNSNFRRHFLGLLLCNEAQAAALLSVLRAEFSRTCRYVTHFTKKKLLVNLNLKKNKAVVF